MTTAARGKVGITDTTLRDGHQSLLATRMTTEDMLPIADKMDKAGFHSLEVWGGATFDSCMRFLNENPWERLRKIRGAFKNTKLQMLLRGQNLVGYKHYADDVVTEFVKAASENGIDIFRIFDALNDVRNMEKSIEEVKKNGKHAQIAVSYTLGSAYGIDYYLRMGKTLKNMGADSICIKDMAGLLDPYAAYDLVKALKDDVGLPIQMHTHYTSGMAAMMYLKAVEAGADVIDTALSPLAMGTSQPATETMVAVLNKGGYDTGINLEDVTELAPYFKEVRSHYKKYDNYKAGVDVNVLRYQVPGGMLSNFINQLAEQNASDRLDEVLAEVPRVRKDLGEPPLVTPSSQIVGTQAVMNVLSGERYRLVTNEVKNYLRGQYGTPAGKINEELRRQIIGDEKVLTGRPADELAPQMKKAAEEIGSLAKNTEEVLMYVLFPQVARDFLAGNIKSELEKAKEPAEEKPAPVPEHDSHAPFAGPGTFARNLRSGKAGGICLNLGGNISNLHITINGEECSLAGDYPDSSRKTGPKPPMPVRKGNKGITPDGRKKASSGSERIDAPMPGKITKIMAGEGQEVKTGETVLILEAMKMENEITAPRDGIIDTIMAEENISVDAGEMLFTLE